MIPRCASSGHFVCLRLGRSYAAAQDQVDATLAHFDSKQVSHRVGDSLITHMLLLLIVNDRHFQVWAELARSHLINSHAKRRLWHGYL